MMTLAETNPVATGLLPLGDLKDHLRLPDGFPDDGSFDARIEQSLRAALSTAEARTGKALFQRQFRWSFEDWRGQDRMPVPTAPLVSLDGVSLLQPDGSITALDTASFTTIKDIHRPALLPKAAHFPTLARGTSVEILLTAGFGATWSLIPPDLREAVLILAVDYFDTPAGAPLGAAPAVVALLQRYRGLTLGRIGG